MDLKRSFIFHRNFTTNQPIDLKAYKEYFFAEEILRSLQYLPAEIRSVCYVNHQKREDWVRSVIIDMEDYLEVSIKPINNTEVHRRSMAGELFDMYLPIGERSDISSPYVRILQNKFDSGHKTFTSFYNEYYSKHHQHNFEQAHGTYCPQCAIWCPFAITKPYAHFSSHSIDDQYSCNSRESRYRARDCLGKYTRYYIEHLRNRNREPRPLDKGNANRNPNYVGYCEKCKFFIKGMPDSFMRENSTVKYIPRTHTEIQCYSQLMEFLDKKVDSYDLSRTKIDAPDTSNLSSYFALGIMSFEHLTSIIRHAIDTQTTSSRLINGFSRIARTHKPNFRIEGYNEFDRQCHWILYSKLRAKTAWDLGFPILMSREQLDKFARWTNGELPETNRIDHMVNVQMQNLKAGKLVSNRFRLMVVFYLVKRLEIDWRYGLFYFEAALIDSHPEVNRKNWDGQVHNRFFSRYNLEAQLAQYS